jgi:hypothetical protein
MRAHLAIALLAGWMTAPPASTARAARARRAQPWDTVARTVRARLEEDPALGKRQLKVDASGLVLIVSGTVGDERERRRALEIARANANPHMIVSDGLSLLPTPPVPPSESRAAQFRFVRTADPPAPPRPPPAPPRPPPPPPRAPPPPPRR